MIKRSDHVDGIVVRNTWLGTLMLDNHVAGVMRVITE